MRIVTLVCLAFPLTTFAAAKFSDSGFARFAPAVFPASDRAEVFSAPSGAVYYLAPDRQSYEYLFASRVQADGKLDESFGKKGVVKFRAVGATSTVPKAHVFQTTGKLLIAANAKAVDSDIVLLRLQDSGELDPTFGVKGYAYLDLFSNSEDEVVSVLVEPDDSLWLIGGTGRGASYQPVVIRLTAEGKLDTRFHKTGIHLPKAVMPRAQVVGAFQQNGKIQIRCSDENGKGAYLLRLDADGEWDTAFGDKGVVVLSELAEAEHPTKLFTTDSSGNYYLGGTRRVETDGDFFVARFDAAGKPDKDFGEDGKVVLDLFLGSEDRLSTLGVDATGGIYLAGSSLAFDPLVAPSAFPGYEIRETKNTLVRLLPDGSIDESFGVRGRSFTFGPHLQPSTTRWYFAPDASLIAYWPNGLGAIAARYRSDGSLNVEPAAPPPSPPSPPSGVFP